ncbi:unnamed protein product, partial [Allacma fusca]
KLFFIAIVTLQLFLSLAFAAVVNDKGSVQNNPDMSLDAASLSCPSNWFEDSTVTVTASGTHVVNGNPIDEYSRLSCKINFKR